MRHIARKANHYPQFTVLENHARTAIVPIPPAAYTSCTIKGLRTRVQFYKSLLEQEQLNSSNHILSIFTY